VTWLSYAEAQHKNVGIGLDQLLSSYELVCSALGAAWVDEQERKDRPLTHQHPLYRELISSTNQALVTVAELATYLKGLAEDAALASVLADLRSEKYPSTLFELAMAHRWKKAGAEIRLQPPTPAGIADFKAAISGTPFVVECSVTPDEIFQEPGFVLPSLVADVVSDTLDREPFAVAVKITVRKSLTGDWQGELRRLAKTLCRDIIDHVHKDLDTHVSHESDVWSIEMEKVTEATEEARGFEWDIAFRAALKPRTEGQPEHKLLDEKRELERARVFLKMPSDTEDQDDFIVRKLKREARQLRGISGPRVVLLDISGVAADVLTIPTEALQQKLLRAMRAIPELACAWVMSRGWSTALRFQYRALYIPNPESTFQIPAAFLQNLMRLEWTWDFIGEREIPLVPRDEAMRDWQRRSRPTQ
jgi:hypothetical protein